MQKLFLILAGIVLTASLLSAKDLPKIDWHSNDAKAKLEMVLQNGHIDKVESVVYSPDGKYIASGSWDKTIKIWDSKNGELLKTFTDQSSMILSVAYNPDGMYITSGNTDGTIKIWDSKTGELIKTLSGHTSSVYSVTYNSDGKYIASGSEDNTIKIWDSHTGKLIKTLIGHTSRVYSATFSPDGKTLASASWDKTIKIWDSHTGKLIKTLIGPSRAYGNPVGYTPDRRAVAYSPDSKNIASGIDGTIEIWDSQTGNLIKTLPGHPEYIRSVTYSPNGEFIASGSEDKTIKIWDSHTGRLINTLSGHSSEVESISYSPEGKTIASGSYDQTIKIWDCKTGELIKTLSGHPDYVTSVAYSPDGRYIAAGCKDKTIKIWDSKIGGLLKTLSGHTRRVRTVAYSPNGMTIASGSEDDTIKIWDSHTGKLINTFSGHAKDGYVLSVVFSPDGKTLASGSYDKTIKIWDSITGDLIKTLSNTDFVLSLAYSKDGKTLATGSYDNTIKIWDSLTSELIKTLSCHEKSKAYSVTFSPDGKTLVAGNDNTIKIWNSHTGELIKTLSGHSRGINSVFYSPDGKTVASGSNGKTIKIWDTITGELVKTLLGHTDTVTSVFYSPDGKTLASGSYDTTIRVWNLETGQSVAIHKLGKEEWFMYNNEGYWDSSKNGGEAIRMVKGFSVFGVDQFALKNNRPDILLKTLGADSQIIEHYYHQYLKRLKKAGFTETDLSSDLHVPIAEINDFNQQSKWVSLNFALSDSKYKLKKYNIYVNDIPLYGAYGKNISSKSLKLSEKIELSSSKNKIEVTCINEKGAESYRALKYADYAGNEKGDLYFIGFGVSQYKNKELNLKYADKDVQDLANSYRSMTGKYHNIVIKTYTNEEVTPENIKKAKELLKNAKVDDTFVLFISGHGVHDTDKEATYYYLTYNTDLKRLSKTAANFETIEDLMQGIPPRNKLFLMDTCESGEVEDNEQNKFYAIADTNGIKARTAKGLSVVQNNKNEIKVQPKRTYLFQKDRYIYNDLARRSGAIVFSSSKGGEFSYESDQYQNGFFTYELINALKGNAGNDNGLISFDKIRDYVSHAVAKLSAGLQNPTVDRDNLFQKFSFPVGK